MVKDLKLYNILEVSSTCSQEEIKNAYKRLALKYHPDKNPNGEEMFKGISEAYQILSDSQKRQHYDHNGYDSNDNLETTNARANFSFPSATAFFNVFFEGVFEGVHSSCTRESSRNTSYIKPKNTSRNITEQLEVTLEQLYTGTTLTKQVNRITTCAKCLGGNLIQCGFCNGRGLITTVTQCVPGLVQQNETCCQQCAGIGEITRVGRYDSYPCRDCNGKGIIKNKSGNLKISIKPGMQTGDTITVANLGNHLPGREPGNITFKIKEIQNSCFRRKGSHLLTTFNLQLVDALCGFEKYVQTLDKREIHVVSMPGQVIKPGDVKKVPNEGMPVRGNPRTKGNLFVQFNIQFPNLVPKNSIPYIRSALGSTTKVQPTTSDVAEKVCLMEVDTNERISFTSSSQTNTTNTSSEQYTTLHNDYSYSSCETH